ncbi:hypothetical protein AMECASPLE_029329 [Ameca splendens]|uniref:Aspartic peptidase DDI1-type domain-containing protein n=1 Tax=Ameca splendens TaxID=208324 RepID=A0ABV0YHF6_9TELE
MGCHLNPCKLGELVSVLMKERRDLKLGSACTVVYQAISALSARFAQKSQPPVIQGALAGIVQQSDYPRFLLQTTLCNNSKQIPLMALIDSGSEQNLISPDLVQKLNLPVCDLEPS